MDVKQQRQQLRQALRSRRRALTEEQQHHAADAVSHQLMTIDAVSRATCIAFYLCNDGEVDLMPFFQQRLKQQSDQTQFVLPVLHPFSKGHLLFLDYTAQTDMVVNRYGIAEPAIDVRAVTPPHSIDIVLMPLVGFDHCGNRLGMGGGFYDRTFANRQHWSQRPTLIGIAHDCQRVESLPVADWDVPLDAIVTPQQVFTTA